MEEASEAELKKLLERRFDQVKVLISYLDGLQFGDHLLIWAVGMDEKGHKHVLAIREGATENVTVVKELLEDLVARGVNCEQKRLFVIDGSKALRAAINAVFGSQHPGQRCRNINCGMCWTTCRKTRNHRCARPCGRLASGGPDGHGQTEETGGVVRPGIPGCCGEPARRPGRMFYG
jgi:hypothetical protein